MTFVVKTRGAGAWLMAEYACPVHGIFEQLVQREADGCAPDSVPCGDCFETSPWTISAPHPTNDGLVVRAVVKGGDTERRPGMLDTRALAEGQSYTDWRKAQREDQKRRRHRQLVDKGVISKKVVVG